MPRRLVQRPQARADAHAQVSYLAQQSPEAAVRFTAELRQAFGRLIRFPHLGRAWTSREPELKGLRRVRLSNFQTSIFYRVTPEALEIVRILHESRDLPPELQES